MYIYYKKIQGLIAKVKKYPILTGIILGLFLNNFVLFYKYRKLNISYFYQLNSRYSDTQFLLKFLELHFQYDFDNFVDRQTQTISFFSKSLRSKKIKEIERLIEKIYASKISQKINVEKIIHSRKDNIYKIKIRYDVIENNEYREFDWILSVKLNPVESSELNPFGWQIESLEGDTENIQLVQNNSLMVTQGGIIELDLPCEIDSIKIIDKLPLQFFYNSKNLNQIQLIISHDPFDKGNLRLICKERLIHLLVEANENFHTKYWKISTNEKKQTKDQKMKNINLSLNSKNTKNTSALEIKRFRDMIKKYFGIEELK